ncbi:MAG: cupin domain-containing protein [Maribacter sp.]
MKLVYERSVPEEGVSHNPAIKKKNLIKQGEIPKLMMYSTAVLKPGQSVELHKHDTMYEVFHIQSGSAMFSVSGKEYELGPGHCITIAPGELHSQSNPFDAEVTWTYFGIATD